MLQSNKMESKTESSYYTINFFLLCIMVLQYKRWVLFLPFPTIYIAPVRTSVNQLQHNPHDLFTFPIPYSSTQLYTHITKSFHRLKTFEPAPPCPPQQPHQSAQNCSSDSLPPTPSQNPSASTPNSQSFHAPSSHRPPRLLHPHL